MYEIPPQQKSIYLQPNPLVDSYAEIEYVRPKIPSKLQSSQFYNYANQVLENEQINQSPLKKNQKRQSSSSYQLVFNLVLVQMINNFTFSARNFGSVCDKIFMNATSYHYQQKFGKKQNLQESNVNENTYEITQEQEPTLDSQIVDHFLSLPEDKRVNFKKVHKLPFYGMILQFKLNSQQKYNLLRTLELVLRNYVSKTKKPKPDQKKILATIRIPFSELLPLINLFNATEIIAILKESLEYNEKSEKVEIKLIETLRNKSTFTPPKENDTFKITENFVVRFQNIKQKASVTVKFPHLLYYVNQFGYEQQYAFQVKQINELISTNFENLISYMSQFNEKELIKYVSGDVNLEDLPEYKIGIETDYSINTSVQIMKHTTIKQVFNDPERNINNIVVLFHPTTLEFKKIQIANEEYSFEEPIFSLTLLNFLKLVIQTQDAKVAYVFKYQFETVEIDTSCKEGKNSKKKYNLSEMHQLPIYEESLLIINSYYSDRSEQICQNELFQN